MAGSIISSVAGKVVGSVAGSIFGAKKASDGAAQAAAIQTDFARETRDLAIDSANRGYTRTNNLVRKDLRQQRDFIRDGFRGETDAIDQAYGDAIQYYDPYIEDGLAAQNALAFENGIGGRPQGYQGYQGSGGYQFRLREAQRALEASAAARGGLYSGATSQRLMDRTQDYASQEFDSYYNRLASMAGRGQQASALASSLTADQGVRRMDSVRTRTGALSGANTNALGNRIAATTNRTNAIVGAASQANATAGNAQAQAALIKNQAIGNAGVNIADTFTNALGFYFGQKGEEA